MIMLEIAMLMLKIAMVMQQISSAFQESIKGGNEVNSFSC